jgi:hypothetical protein
MNNIYLITISSRNQQGEEVNSCGHFTAAMSEGDAQKDLLDDLKFRESHLEHRILSIKLIASSESPFVVQCPTIDIKDK